MTEASFPAPPTGLTTPAEVEAQALAYTTPWCPYCRAALALLELREIEYVEIDVQGNRPARGWLMQVTGQHTVPQIFLRGRSIGGYDELAALDREGKLAELLATERSSSP